MTGLDRNDRHPGYWPSAWPVECGGNRRQKSAPGRLDAANRIADVTTRSNGRWNVMAIEREPGEWFLGGTMAAFSGPPPFGWVERIDLETLEPVVSSPELPCGDHVWCGAILAHADGSIMSVNGSFLHRLDADDLRVVAERRLPVDRSHNGLLALADGSLVTKDLRLEGQGGTTITRVEPDGLTDVAAPIVLPEGSMGRIAADIDADGTESVYVPGTDHVWKLVVDGDRLVVDEWRPSYRSGHERGLAWDACISDDALWIMDCGDVPSVRAIHTVEPNGRFATPPGGRLSWRQTPAWRGALRLHRVALGDDAAIASVDVTGVPAGGIIAPPVHVPEHGVAVAWDSVNGGLVGIATIGAALEPAWRLDVRPSMQPVVFPDSAELVINDFTVDGADHLVVVDVRDGTLLDRVPTGSRLANGMFLSAGGDADVLYCTTGSVARIRWV